MLFRDAFSRCFGDSDSELESDEPNSPLPDSGKGPKQFGLELLNPTAAEEGNYAYIQLDVIAVHGLGGHRINSWTESDSKYFWLKDLPEKLGSVSARVFTFGYDATVAFGRSVAGISDIAGNLLQDLRINRRKLEEKNRPLIFICHSLGGIVVKQALVMARMDANFRELHNSVYGVAFMGTPHLGSNAADIASRTSSIARIALLGRKAHPNLVKPLKTNSQFLLDVSKNFRHQELKEIISFYEMEVMQPMNCLIVEKNSAILNFPGESQVGCNADHRSICKFPSPTDKRLESVCGHLQIMAKSAVNQNNNISAEGRIFLKKLREMHHLDPEKQLTEVLRKKSAGTATWIQQNDTFVNWKNSPNHETLWLNGDPGSGKSVMSASIIEKLHEDFKNSGSRKPLILHFFFDGKATERKNHLNAMPGLLYQILTFKPFHAVDVANRTSDEFPTSTLDKCTGIIHRLIKNIPKIFLILDAIDECEVLDLELDKSERGEEKRSLLRRLFELKEHTHCLKFLVTSRTHPGLELEPVFKEYNPPNISLTRLQGRVKDDIKRYISDELQNFKSIRTKGDRGREERIREKVVTTILSQAGGMFLYASLAWTTFRDWDDEWNEIGVEARFEKLKALGAQRVGAGTTKTLYSLYLKILEMLSSNSQRLERNAKKLFKCLVTAHTPLTLEELRILYALEPEHDSKASMERFVSMGDFRDVLKKNCGALVRITEASQTVHLAHHSIKEFFLEANDHPFSFNRTDAELDISSACLTYLSLKDLSNTSLGGRSKAGSHEDDFRLVGEYPFLRYAVLYWSQHAAQVQDDPSLWDQFVSWTSSNNLDLYIRIFWYFKGRDDPPQNATPMHILCFHGLDKLAEKAFSVQRSGKPGDGTPLVWAVVSGCDTVGRTPLHWATVNGHDKVVKLLLGENADPHQKDNFTFTPVDLAMEFGNVGVVTLLMRDEKCEEHSDRWMEMAAVSGRKEMMEFLLKRGADVNASHPNSEYGSALHAAAYEGHTEVVKLLLANHADPNHYHSKHGTPLQTAVYEEHYSIVDLLITHGANVNGKAGIHGTALQSAAKRGLEKMAEVLIQNGADVNAKGVYFGSALYAAEYRGHTKVQVILRKSGARSIKPTRRPRETNTDAEHLLALVEKEIKKGRQSRVEKRAGKIKADMIEAIISQNKRKLGWCLDFGVHAFKLAIKLEREAFLEFMVNLCMTVLQEAVAKDYPEGIELILKCGAKVLLAAVNEGKASLVQRMLLACVKDLKTLVDDELYPDAGNLLHTAYAVYIEICETGNRELIEIVGSISIGLFEDLVKGFKKNMAEVADIYLNRWVQAVQRQDEKVAKSIGKATIEVMLAGAGSQEREVVKCFMPSIAMHMQKILGPGQSNSVKWLLDEVLPASKTIIQEQDELAMNKVTVGVELFLALVHQSQGKNYDLVRSIVLDRSMKFLKEVEHAGLLDKSEDTVKNLVHEKLKSCENKKQLLELEGRLSEILGAISEVGKANRRISAVMGNIGSAIERSAADIIKRTHE